MEFWFSEFHTPDVKHSIRVNKQLYSKQSDYQRIDIFETPEFGRVLTLDGNVMLTERDEFIYDEMIVHVPMEVDGTLQVQANEQRRGTAICNGGLTVSGIMNTAGEIAVRGDGMTNSQFQDQLNAREWLKAQQESQQQQ